MTRKSSLCAQPSFPATPAGDNSEVNKLHIDWESACMSVRASVTRLCRFLLFVLSHALFCATWVSAAIVNPVVVGTITDENGDGSPETVGLGFGHPNDPNFGTMLTQKSPGFERRSVEEFTLTGVPSVQTASFLFRFRNSNTTQPATFELYLAAGDGALSLSDFFKRRCHGRFMDLAAHGKCGPLGEYYLPAQHDSQRRESIVFSPRTDCGDSRW